MKKLIILTLAVSLLISLAACGPTSVKDMDFQYEYQGVNYTGTYTGGVEKKIPNGEGTFTAKGSVGNVIYAGGWAAGKMTGAGKLTDAQFTIKFSDVTLTGAYEGATIDGVPAGKGSFTAVSSDGVKYCYTGDFKNGTFDGQGSRTFDGEKNYKEAGTYTAGEFTPTPKEMFCYLGTSDNDALFSVRALSAQFLGNNANLFTSSTAEGLDAYVDTEYRPEVYTKSPDKYGDKLIHLNQLTIAQISENQCFNYPSVTFILATDANYHYYFIYYLGTADVYTGDKISAYLLPLDYFTYKTTAETQNWAIAAAAAYVTK